LLGGYAEEGHVQNIGLAGIDDGSLLRSEFGGDEVLFDGVGVDAVIDFGKLTLGRPPKSFLLFFFEPLKFSN
jgi:hypothetical protein